MPARLLNLAIRRVCVSVDALKRGDFAALVRVRKSDVFFCWREDQVGIYRRDMDAIRGVSDRLPTLDPHASCGAFGNDIGDASVDRFHAKGSAPLSRRVSFALTRKEPV